MSTVEALTEVLAMLAGTCPRSITSTGSRAYDPTVTVDFATVADLDAFAAKDRVRVQVVDKTVPLQFYEHSAMYERPGRRMLITCRVFAHMPEWPGGAV